MTPRLRLISHELCPYVQRAVIVAMEKSIKFERVDIDLAHKPAWFLAISPTGKTPLLEVEGHGVLFESAVIAEYLDELDGKRLLPAEAFERARHRAWIEFASGTLAAIGQLYSAPDGDSFGRTADALARRIRLLEIEVAGPWFAGQTFGLVDTAFAPAFRYLDVFRDRGGPDFFAGAPIAAAWARRLAERPSVRSAVRPNYAERLVNFVRARGSYLGQLLEASAAAA